MELLETARRTAKNGIVFVEVDGHTSTNIIISPRELRECRTREAKEAAAAGSPSVTARNGYWIDLNVRTRVVGNTEIGPGDLLQSYNLESLTSGWGMSREAHSMWFARDHLLDYAGSDCSGYLGLTDSSLGLYHQESAEADYSCYTQDQLYGQVPHTLNPIAPNMYDIARSVGQPGSEMLTNISAGIKLGHLRASESLAVSCFLMIRRHLRANQLMRWMVRSHGRMKKDLNYVSRVCGLIGRADPIDEFEIEPPDLMLQLPASDLLLLRGLYTTIRDKNISERELSEEERFRLFFNLKDPDKQVSQLRVLALFMIADRSYLQGGLLDFCPAFSEGILGHRGPWRFGRPPDPFSQMPPLYGFSLCGYDIEIVIYKGSRYYTVRNSGVLLDGDSFILVLREFFSCGKPEFLPNVKLKEEFLYESELPLLTRDGVHGSRGLEHVSIDKSIVLRSHSRPDVKMDERLTAALVRMMFPRFGPMMHPASQVYSEILTDLVLEGKLTDIMTALSRN